MTPDEDTAADTSGADTESTADPTPLERSQEAIDDAHEAVKKVAATDSIDEEATGAGELPAFADSTDDADKPEPDASDEPPAS